MSGTSPHTASSCTHIDSWGKVPCSRIRRSVGIQINRWGEELVIVEKKAHGMVVSPQGPSRTLVDKKIECVEIGQWTAHQGQKGRSIEDSPSAESRMEGLASSISCGVATNSFTAVTQIPAAMVPHNDSSFKDLKEKNESCVNGVKMSNSKSVSIEDKTSQSTGNMNGDGKSHEEDEVTSSLLKEDNATNRSKDSESLLESSPTRDNSSRGSPCADNNDSNSYDASKNDNSESSSKASPIISEDICSKENTDSVMSRVDDDNNDSNSYDANKNDNSESSSKASPIISEDICSKENTDSVMSRVDDDASQHSENNTVENESLSNSKPCINDEQDSDRNSFSLGNRVRNSFKDIMTKMAQDKDSGLEKILSKQKSKDFGESGNSSESDTTKKGNIFENIIAADLKKTENSNSSVSSSTSDQAAILKSDSEMEGVLSEVSKKIAFFPTGSSDEDSNKSKVPNGFSEFSDNATDNDLAGRDSDVKPELSDTTKKGITFSSFLKQDNSTDTKTETSTDSNVANEVKSDCVEEEMPEASEKQEENSMETDSVKQEEDLESKKSEPEPVFNSTENSRDSFGRASVGSDRKRPVSDSSDSGSSNKRCRLDEVIGKLGSKLGVEPDSLEERQSTPLESDNDNTGRTASESDNDEDDKIDTASSVLEESEDEKSDTITTKERLLRVTEKEISRIVQRKLRTYLKKQKDSLLAQMSDKINELQSQSEQWKQQTKKLREEVRSLTILNQRLEKRKAATAALRQINTRSFGVQVDETKADLMAQMQLTHNKSPGKFVKNSSIVNPTTTINSPQVQNSHIITQLNSKVLANKALSSATVTTIAATNILTQALPNMINATNVVPSTSNSSLIRTIIAEPSGTQRIITSVPSQTPSTTSVTSPPQLVKYPVTNTVRNLIEMTKHTITKDSINSSKTVTSTHNVLIVSSTCAPSSNVGIRPVINTTTPLTNPVTQVVGKHSTVKIIDLTADDDKTSGLQGRAIQNIPASNISQPAGLQLPQGSYIISTGQAPSVVAPGQSVRPPGPGGLFQMVIASNNSTPIKPGSLLTVVPARNLAPPLPTQTTGIRPSAVVTTVVTTPSPIVTQIPQQIRPGQQLQQSTGKPVVVRQSIPSVNVTPGSTHATPAQVPQITMQRQPPPPYSAAVQNAKSSQIIKPTEGSILQHPAPLPSTPTVVARSSKLLPPKPSLKISRVSQGIVLSWNMTVTEAHSDIATYQLYAYQEGSAPPTSSLWKKVGDVKALPLPMACTLTQFQEGNKYHFAVRALDQHGRMGAFSDPSTIHLLPQKS